MRMVKVKVGQLWAFPTSESWYQKYSLNSGTELKYEGYRVTKVEPWPNGIQRVELQHVKGKTINKIVGGPEWPETEQQKLIEDVP